MKKFIVTVRRDYMYEVEAESHEAAIDAVSEGKGYEVDYQTCEMYADEIVCGVEGADKC
jgi:hypothetical protein